MAKTRTWRLWVDDPPPEQGVKAWRWYWGPPGGDLATLVDAAEDPADLPPFFPTTAPEVLIGEGDLAEGRYEFVNTALDEVGNESTPYQHPGWADVLIDVTPPDPPTGGGIGTV